MNFLNKLEYKYGKYSIQNLIKYIVGIQAILYIITMFTNNSIIYDTISLDALKVMQGEVWRSVTFAIHPPGTFSIIFMFFALWILYFIGNGLEREWGSFKFNIYYLSGIILTNVAVFFSFFVLDISVSGITAYYIYLSLFLAFATIYPDFTFRLFLIIPVKVKWLAYLDAILLLYEFYLSGIAFKLVILASVTNYFIFFGKHLYRTVFNRSKSVIRKKNYESKIISNKDYLYKCTTCGLTDTQNPDMVFRYCSKCDGQHAYCEKHLFNHEHIQKK